MAHPLTDSTIVARAPGKISAEIDDETVVLDVDSGHFFHLNVSGARIWGLLDTPLSQAALCARLEADFDVDAEVCRVAVRGFIEEMGKRGMVALHDA
ncbi:MAG: PqqD family protein [Sphingomonas sp.]